ncbi:lipase maturation factor family protein [Pendulispora rubella]|uniref:Lipase maturation factor family protein n=1 Tax=Pendulispora rubella TaxID=2741070 RepID=A0ABZ2LAY1_9BACT
MQEQVAELARPLVVYDGACGFCKRWIERFRLRTGDAVDYAPYQDVAERFPEIGEDAFRAALHVIDLNGIVHRGADAVFSALAHAPGGRWLAMLYRGSPGFARVSEAVYAWVASHRIAASWLTTLFIGRDVRPATFVLTRWIFLRLVGICALAAFVSLATQIEGLIGSHGIAPAPPLLGMALGDGALVGIAWAGAAASALVALDVATGWALLAAWLLYLALANVSGPFLQYQWDALLLETLVAALFLAPWRRIRPSLDRERPPARTALWLLRFLIFKLVFLSGAVKRLSGDPSWRDLTALDYHYWTQPLPAWTSWYVAQLPPWAHALSARGMFFIELYLPLLVFVPRRGRWLAFLGFLLLQLAIGATGNYGFFNALTIALAVILLDDAQILGALPARFARKLEGVRTTAQPLRRLSIVASLAGALLFFSAERTWYAVRGLHEEPAAFRAMGHSLAPLSLVHAYGLFAVMTTTRREIHLEGSDDGITWQPYTFRYKPDDPRTSPRFIPMHLPRLDWQMWFFALSEDCAEDPAYIAFVARLLDGSPAVSGLLAGDPFAGRKPRYIRSRSEMYRFTTRAERAATGAYWAREPTSDYCPVLGER